MKNGKPTRAELARYNACYKCRKADATSHICTEFGVPLSWCCPTEQCYNEMHEFSLNSAEHYDDGTPMSILPDKEICGKQESCGKCVYCARGKQGDDTVYVCILSHKIVEPDDAPMSISPDFVSEPILAHDGEGFCGNCQHCSFWQDGFYHCTKHGIVDPDDASCKDFISYPF